MTEERTNSLLQEQIQRYQRDHLLSQTRGLSPLPGVKQQFLDETTTNSSEEASDDEGTVDGDTSGTEEDN